MDADEGDRKTPDGLPPEVAAQVPEFFKMLAEAARVQGGTLDTGQLQSLSYLTAAFASTTHIGPLPPPEQLRGYENVLPGSADRIIRMAESQLGHRQELEKTAINDAKNRSWWGLWLGFVISLIFLALSAVIILKGHDAAGATLGSVDIVALAGVFVYGRVEQRRERVQKEGASQTPLPPQPPARQGS